MESRLDLAEPIDPRLDRTLLEVEIFIRTDEHSIELNPLCGTARMRGEREEAGKVEIPCLGTTVIMHAISTQLDLPPWDC